MVSKLNKRTTHFTYFFIYVLLLIIIFGFIYKHIHEIKGDFTNFNQDIDPFYYSVATMFTVGYGDHSSITTVGKAVTCVQIVLFWSSVIMFNIYTF